MVVTGKMSLSCNAVASCNTATGDGRPPGGRALGFGKKMAERGGFSTLPVRPSTSQVRIPNTIRQEKNGGERGIRTPDRGLAYTRFPSVRLQPLGHLSSRVSLTKLYFTDRLLKETSLAIYDTVKNNIENGGREGIRTPDTLSGIPVFKTGAINHSATLPLGEAVR